MQDYRKLLVWRKAHHNALTIRRITNGFPRTGYAEIKSQLIRAAESIPFNIVEGTGSASGKEFARFLDISIKSTCEVEYQLELCSDYEIVEAGVVADSTRATVEIRKMLCGLRKRVLEAGGGE